MSDVIPPAAPNEGGPASAAADSTIEPVENAELALASLGERLRRRPVRTVLAQVCWLGAIGCILAIILTPASYRASAMIKLEEQAPYIVFDSLKGESTADRYVDTQIELIRSPMVLEVLLANPEIANAPGIAESNDRMAMLRSHLSIDRISKSDLFNVTYVSPSPKLAATVANAVIVEYLKIQTRVGLDRYQRVVDLLEDERRRRLVDVEELKKKVMALSAEVTGHDPFGLGLSLDVRRSQDLLSDAYFRLVNLEAERAEVEAEIEAIESEINPPAGSTSGSADAPAASPAAKPPWQDAVAELSRQLEALVDSNVSLEGSAAVERLADGIAQVELEFQSLEPLSAAASTSAHEELAELKRRLLRVNREHNLLRERFEARYRDAQQGNSKAVALTFAQADLAREEKVLEMIAQRKLAMQTESRSPARVSIQQKAVLPQVPVSPLYSWHKGLAIGAAALFAAALILTAAALQGMPRQNA